jgi:protease-4
MPNTLTPREPTGGSQSAAAPSAGGHTIQIQFVAPQGRLRRWLLFLALVASVYLNVSLLTGAGWPGAQRPAAGPQERFHSGKARSQQKLAVIEIHGTIMPPFTARILKNIERAKQDEAVKGVLLSIDSPGGFVSDSHQIYRELERLSAVKPVVVSMKSLAASGGYYVAMGAGPKSTLFAEPTTWTGSIGVIIPHYEVTELASKAGVEALPLKTGEFKDSLSPFRKMTDRDKALWQNILDQSFEQFLEVIALNRPRLDRDQVRALATGQIYTAKDALAAGLLDQIGYEDDALAALSKAAGVTGAKVITYEHPLSLIDLVARVAANTEPGASWRALADAGAPRAMYLWSWAAPFSGAARSMP